MESTTTISKDKKDSSKNDVAVELNSVAMTFGGISSIIGALYSFIRVSMYLEVRNSFHSRFVASASNYLCYLLNGFPHSFARFLLWPFEIVLAITWVIVGILLWPLTAFGVAVLGALGFALVGFLWGLIISNAWWGIKALGKKLNVGNEASKEKTDV